MSVVMDMHVFLLSFFLGYSSNSLFHVLLSWDNNVFMELLLLHTRGLGAGSSLGCLNICNKSSYRCVIVVSSIAGVG